MRRKQVSSFSCDDKKLIPSRLVIASADAAALQSEMIKKYSLMSSMTTRRRPIVNHSNSHMGSTSSQVMTSTQFCPSCGEEQLVKSNLLSGDDLNACVACAYVLPPPSIPLPPPTLAQIRGLVPLPNPDEVALTAAESVVDPLGWYVVENRLRVAADPDASCAICLEAFRDDMELLLSCGHLFHRPCLRSFENFHRDSDPACPLCRTQHYQKKVTSLGSQAYRRICARTIQRIVRGFIARRSYRLVRRELYRSGAGNEVLRRAFMAKEIAAVSNAVTNSTDARAARVDSLLSSTDRTIADGRELDRMFEDMLRRRTAANENSSVTESVSGMTETTSHVTLTRVPLLVNNIPAYIPNEFCVETGGAWLGVCETAISRTPGECAICMSSVDWVDEGTRLPMADPPRACLLLSCAHVYHATCLSSFEAYAGASAACPMCRSTYSRRLLASADAIAHAQNLAKEAEKAKTTLPPPSEKKPSATKRTSTRRVALDNNRTTVASATSTSVNRTPRQRSLQEQRIQSNPNNPFS